MTTEQKIIMDRYVTIHDKERIKKARFAMTEWSKAITEEEKEVVKPRIKELCGLMPKDLPTHSSFSILNPQMPAKFVYAIFSIFGRLVQKRNTRNIDLFCTRCGEPIEFGSNFLVLSPKDPTHPQKDLHYGVFCLGGCYTTILEEAEELVGMP